LKSIHCRDTGWPVSRRQALVAWARETGALVAEDDYDSEFRYDVGPLPALHSMDPDVIVYLGTASKVLATAFGAGWLVAPPELTSEIILAKFLEDFSAEALGQLRDRESVPVLAIRAAGDRGADTMDIGVDEPDLAARRLYESLGFSNRSGGDGPLMYVYEREL